MRYSLLLIGFAGLVAACGRSPQVDERNASVEEVAQKVRGAGAENLFNPGRWQTKVTVEEMTIPGMPPGLQAKMKQHLAGRQTATELSCLTAADARRPGGSFFGGQKASNCRYDRFTMSGGRIDAVMRCQGDGPGTMVMTVAGTYTPDASTTRVDMEVSGGPEGAMKIRAVTENRRLGDCTGNEAKAGGEQQ